VTCAPPPSGNLACTTSCRSLEAKISSAFTNKISVTMGAALGMRRFVCVASQRRHFGRMEGTYFPADILSRHKSRLPRRRKAIFCAKFAGLVPQFP
jgi:hypothetical protein